MSEKKPLTGLFRDDPATPEGKYLVKRRDGTVMTKPNFVLVATDPLAIAALRAYAEEGCRMMLDKPERAAVLGLTNQLLPVSSRSQTSGNPTVKNTAIVTPAWVSTVRTIRPPWQRWRKG